MLSVCKDGCTSSYGVPFFESFCVYYSEHRADVNHQRLSFYFMCSKALLSEALWHVNMHFSKSSQVFLCCSLGCSWILEVSLYIYFWKFHLVAYAASDLKLILNNISNVDQKNIKLLGDGSFNLDHTWPIYSSLCPPFCSIGCIQ